MLVFDWPRDRASSPRKFRDAFLTSQPRAEFFVYLGGGSLEAEAEVCAERGSAGSIVSLPPHSICSPFLLPNLCEFTRQCSLTVRPSRCRCFTLSSQPADSSPPSLDPLAHRSGHPASPWSIPWWMLRWEFHALASTATGEVTYVFFELSGS